MARTFLVHAGLPYSFRGRCCFNCSLCD